jgi:hypothetical protein
MESTGADALRCPRVWELNFGGQTAWPTVGETVSIRIFYQKLL